MPEPPTVTIQDLRDAQERLRGVAHRTPVVRSKTLDEHFGAEVWLKCEHLQRGGAFKFRGAYNALSRLDEAQRAKGVLTYSSGNHAGGLALAGKLLGVPVTVVMPREAPRVKREATEGYGAQIVLYDRDETTRERLGAEIAAERGLTVIPPYDHPHIIAGQGTAGIELFEQAAPLDLLISPLGGGGLLSGLSIAARALAPECVVIGVEPEAGDDGARSMRAGHLVTVANPETIADGARTPSLSELTFSFIRANVREVVTVSDEELVAATFFLWERTKMYVEPTGALGVAGLLSGKVQAKGHRVGVVLSGGNVDLDALTPWIARR